MEAQDKLRQEMTTRPTEEIEDISYAPPTERDFLSVNELKFLHEENRLPKGSWELFWGFHSKIVALSNLEETDIDGILLDYDYCVNLYQLMRRQPKAIIKDGKQVDPMSIINTCFKEDMFLTQGRVHLLCMAKRSKKALNLQLMTMRSLPQSVQQQQPQKKPGLFARILGR